MSGINVNYNGNEHIRIPSHPVTPLSFSEKRGEKKPPLRRFGTRLELRPRSLLWTTLLLLLVIVMVIVLSKVLRDYFNIGEDN